MEEQNPTKIKNKKEQNLTKEEKEIETELSNIDSKDKDNSSKIKFFFFPSLKNAIIFLFIVIVIDQLRAIIVNSIRKKNFSNKGNDITIRIPDESSFSASSSSSIAQISSSTPLSSCEQASSGVQISSSASLSSSSCNFIPEYFIPFDISFEEVEKLLNSKIIGENHKILKESNKSIIKSLEEIKKLAIDLKTNRTNISYIIPKFQNNFTDNTLKIVKDDINLYNSKYEELEGKANNLTETVSDSIKNITIPLNNLKESVNKIYEQFENITKSICLPLFLEKNGLISTIESNNNEKRFYPLLKLQKYKDEVEQLNNIYNNFFIYFKSIIEIIIENMKELPNSVKNMNENIKRSFLYYKKLLSKFEKEKDIQKMHENLLSIKQSFLDIKKNMNNKIEKIQDRISFLEDLHKNNIFNLKKFENETLIRIANINHISEEIILEINDMRRQNGEKELKYSGPNISFLIADSIINSIDNLFQILINIEIMKKNEILSIAIIINIEERTSLDLLFVMDITGSLTPYFDETKKNIFNIINRIANRCPGIDINLGFIGYKNKYEKGIGNIIDIEFTKNYTELKNNISEIISTGQRGLSKDMTWAFEKALNKTWKSNTKLIIFVSDASNHVDKYNNSEGLDVNYHDDYPDDIPGKRNLEDIIKELAYNGVSIFCTQLTKDTDKILKIFESIYKNYEKSQFQIVPINFGKNFSDIIVDSAVNIYENQRMDDGSILFEYNKNKLRIYLIEINPILTKITNKELYKNNNGHPYASEYFDQDRELALKEMKEDLEFSSHGKIKIEFISHIFLNDFPKYKKLIELSNGKKDYKLDEETYILMSKKEDNPDKGDWEKLINDPKYQEIDTFQFDYNYIVKKYKLDKLRKNNVFDQVWIYGIDPLSTYETIMVGSNPYWINGEPLKKDCKNFMVVSVAFSRRDANLHALGHSFEDIFSYAFTGEMYDPDKIYDDTTQGKYDKLNYWEKFSLINKNSKGENAGVGNIHFPFNGETDYDYYNENKVYSNWEYWENYPNIKGEKKKYNNDEWMSFKGNEIIINDANSCQDPDRLYIRFWMYLIPHIDGYTETGQLNNWWDYVTNCDYVVSVKSENEVIRGTIGEEVKIAYKVFYKSGSVETIRNINSDNNIKINGDCISYENIKLIGSKKGACSLIIYRDGNSEEFEIIIN